MSHRAIGKGKLLVGDAQIALAAGRDWSLQVFAGGTWMLTAEERVPQVNADVSSIENSTNFTPEQAFGVFSFGDQTAVRIKNVARSTVTGGVAGSLS